MYLTFETNFHHKDWLTCSDGTDRILLSQATLLRWLTFLLGYLTDSSICSTVVFTLLGNPDQVFVTVSIDFPLKVLGLNFFIAQLITILFLIGVVFLNI